MPSKSKSQHNLMAMVANDPAAAKRVGIPQSVGREFVKADVGRKFGSGGRTDRQGINRPNTDHGKLAINKPKTDHGELALFARGGDVAESKAMIKKEVSFMKKKGAPKSMIKHEESEMKGMKKMAMGGGPLMSKGMTTAKMGKVTAGGKRPHGEHTVQQKGHTKGTQVKMAGGKGMKKGGKVC